MRQNLDPVYTLVFTSMAVRGRLPAHPTLWRGLGH